MVANDATTIESINPQQRLLKMSIISKSGSHFAEEEEEQVCKRTGEHKKMMQLEWVALTFLLSSCVFHSAQADDSSFDWGASTVLQSQANTTTTTTTSTSTTTTTVRPEQQHRLAAAAAAALNEQLAGTRWLQPLTGSENSSVLTMSTQSPAAADSSVTAARLNKSSKTATNVYRRKQTIRSSIASSLTSSAPTRNRKLSQQPPFSAANAPKQHSYRLPAYFDYKLYKQFHDKHYSNRKSDERHKRIYLRRALKVFEERALYRAQRQARLAYINELSDLTAKELDAFKAGQARRPARSQQTRRVNGADDDLLRSSHPSAADAELFDECCTYEQVYERMIELLNRTRQDNDWTLSRAYVAELEQRPLLASSERSESPEVIAPSTTTTSFDDDFDAAAAKPPPVASSNRNSLIADTSGATNMDWTRALERGRAGSSRSEPTQSVEPREDAGQSAALPTGRSNKTDSAPSALRPVAAGAWQAERAVSKQGRGSPTAAAAAAQNDEPVAEEVKQSLIEEVRRQLAEQLSEETPLGRRLHARYSKIFGQPVRISVTPIAHTAQQPTSGSMDSQKVL